MSAGKLKYTLVVRHPDTSAPTALLADQEVPDWATDLVHADDLVGSDDSGGEDATGYEAKTVAELKAEIAGRNEGREDEAKIPASGNKPDLVAALEADDAASQDADDDSDES